MKVKYVIEVDHGNVILNGLQHTTSCFHTKKAVMDEWRSLTSEQRKSRRVLQIQSWDCFGFAKFGDAKVIKLK